MKKNILTTLFGFSLLFTTINGCNDLDLVPLNSINESIYYKTEADFDGAIYASYSQIQQYWESFTGSNRLAFQRVALASDDDTFIQHPSSLPYDVLNFESAQGDAALFFKLIHCNIQRDSQSQFGH